MLLGSVQGVCCGCRCSLISAEGQKLMLLCHTDMSVNHTFSTAAQAAQRPEMRSLVALGGPRTPSEGILPRSERGGRGSSVPPMPRPGAAARPPLHSGAPAAAFTVLSTLRTMITLEATFAIPGDLNWAKRPPKERSARIKRQSQSLECHRFECHRFECHRFEYHLPSDDLHDTLSKCM